MSRTEKLRGKLFGRKTPENNEPAPEPDTRNSPEAPLSIHIPKPDLPRQPAAHPKRDNKTDSSPRPEIARDSRTFRERLVENLGREYHGAERYRLVQDDNKELHWKRWGPYLSDRQWVSVQYSAYMHYY